MSANNCITINKKTFVVKNVDVESRYGFVVGKAKTLDEAIEIVEKHMEDEYLEYGIHFVTK